MKDSTSSTPGHGITRKEMPHDDVRLWIQSHRMLFSQQVSLPIHSDATTTTSKSILAKLGENTNCFRHISLVYHNDLFQDCRDDEPQITEEVLFSEMLMIYVKVLVPELKEHGILLDESIMYSLDPPMETMDELHYVMYRLGKKENGLQIFYRCLRETQDEYPRHRLVADRIESEGNEQG